MKLLLVVAALICCASLAMCQTKIDAKDAKAHIGDLVTITDKVYGGKQLASNMLLIDVGGWYPNEMLSIMIPPADRSKFTGQPNVDWKDKTITVTGKITDYKGKPEIIVHDPAKITISQ